MAEELRAEYEQRLKAQAGDGDKTPKELIELDKRLARLRNGDPDLSADDLQTAIEKAERYRLELLHAQQSGRSQPGAAGEMSFHTASVSFRQSDLEWLLTVADRQKQT
jgi:hypothetical protein